MSKQRIVWTDQEKDKIVTRAAELRFLNPSLSDVDALRSAQKELLHASRQRNLTPCPSLVAKWARTAIGQKLLHLNLEAKETENAKSEPPEVPVTDVSQVSTEDLLMALAERIAQHLNIRAIVKGAVADVIAEMLPKADVLQQKPKKAVKEHTVLILGLLPSQFNELKEEFKGMLELRMGSASVVANAKAARYMDAVMAHTKHLGHDMERSIQPLAKEYIRVSGGVTSMKSALEDYWVRVNE